MADPARLAGKDASLGGWLLSRYDGTGARGAKVDQSRERQYKSCRLAMVAGCQPDVYREIPAMPTSQACRPASSWLSSRVSSSASTPSGWRRRSSGRKPSGNCSCVAMASWPGLKRFIFG